MQKIYTQLSVSYRNRGLDRSELSDMTCSLSLHSHVPERSSPSRVGFAAQSRRALDRSGPFQRCSRQKGKGANAKGTFTGPCFCLPLVGAEGCSTQDHRSTLRSCQVCWRITEMAQRSIRRFLNLISEEALLRPYSKWGRERGGIHHGQESLTPLKAEYTSADQLVFLADIRLKPFLWACP
jgi:hypothetical protein